MRVLNISSDLLLEIHDDGVIRLVSHGMMSDRDPDCAGAVVIYQHELDSLIAALISAKEQNDHHHRC